MFVEKYKPTKTSEVVGQDKALKKVLFWFKKWRPGDKALLLHGPPGTGKTCTIEALAAESGYDFIEMNASDYRSAKQIREVIGRSVQQMSLVRRGKIFLIDEIDGITGREDRGGVGEIIKVIKSSQYPLVLTSNNPWNKKLQSLRSYCTLVDFSKVSVFDIQRRLKEICIKEKLNADGVALRKIAKQSSGDMRSAINDLDLLSRGRDAITAEQVEDLGNREREINIFDALKIIFKTQNTLTAKLALNGLDKSPEDMFWWIENNILNEYEKAEEIAAAYDALSKADIFKERIRTSRNWKLLPYMIDMMTGGVATAKKEMYRKFTRYQYPSNIITLGRSKAKRAAQNAVYEKFGSHLHCSKSKFRENYLPFIRIMMKNKQAKKQIISSINLTNEEVEVLN